MNERLGFILFYFIYFVFMAKTLNAGETFWHADFPSKDYRGTRPHLKLFDRFVLKSIKNEKKINVTGTKGEMVLILEGEFQMASMNNYLAPKIESVFFMTGEEHFFVSSSLVKEVFGHGGDISNFVPSEVLKHLKKVQEKT